MHQILNDIQAICKIILTVSYLGLLKKKFVFCLLVYFIFLPIFHEAIHHARQSVMEIIHGWKIQYLFFMKDSMIQLLLHGIIKCFMFNVRKIGNTSLIFCSLKDEHNNMHLMINRNFLNERPPILKIIWGLVLC